MFLNKRGIVKIGDFGISKIMNAKILAQTVLGTPYYFSPEMVAIVLCFEISYIITPPFLFSAKVRSTTTKATFGPWAAFWVSFAA